MALSSWHKHLHAGGRSAQSARGRVNRARRSVLQLEALEDRSLMSVSLVSVNAAGTDSGDRSSFLLADQGSAPSRPRLSADGRYLAFTSLARDLVPNHASDGEDVYVRDLVQGTTTLVSINLAGNGDGPGACTNPVISSDGRYVAFESDATDLVAGMTASFGGTWNVFVRDLTAGTTTLVSRSTTGTGGGNGPSSNASISADGHRVAFQSRATDLLTVAGGALPTALEVYVCDLPQGAVSLASVSTVGGFGSGDSGNPVLSGNGKVVAFTSLAEDLVGNDANRKQDVFARDLDAQFTHLVSATPANSLGGPHAGNGRSSAPALSADGHVVAFVSEATDLDVTSHTAADVYRRDLPAATTALVSKNRFGNGGNAASAEPVLSADGRFVAFTSAAFDLVLGDLNFGAFDPGRDVFVRDMQQPGVELVSVSAGGGTGDRSSLRPDLSADGRFVTFESQAVDLRPGTVDTDGFIDVFRRDRQTKTTLKLSRSLAGGAADGESHHAIQSADGGIVAFDSSASNLVAHDSAGSFTRDVFAEAFVVDPPPPPPPPPSTQQLQFAKATYSVNENGINALIEVVRTGGTDGTVSATVSTGGGTASTTQDYTPVRQTVILGPGQLNGFVSIRITDDHSDEPNETVGLTLSNPTAATLGSQKTATLTILDDDPAQHGLIKFLVPGYRVREGASEVSVLLTRVNGSDGAVTVRFTTSNGSASAGSDYVAVNRVVTFAAGQTSAIVPIHIRSDTADEPDETVRLTLSQPTGGAALVTGATRGVVTIVDDDPPLVRVREVRMNSVPLIPNLLGGPLTFARVTEVVVSLTGVVEELRHPTPALLRTVFQFVRQGVALAIDFNPIVVIVRTEMRVTLKLLDVLGVGGILREGLYKFNAKAGRMRDSLNRLIDPDGDGVAGGTLTRDFRQLPGDVNRTGRVDASDAAQFAKALGKKRGQAGYLTAFDFDDDGVIGPRDQVQFRRLLNKRVF